MGVWCVTRVTALKRGVNEMVGGVYFVDSLLQCGVPDRHRWVCGCFARVTALKRGVNGMVGVVHFVDSLLKRGVNEMVGGVHFVDSLLQCGVTDRHRWVCGASLVSPR